MGVATEGTEGTEDTEIIAEKYHSTRSALDRSMITDYWFPDRRESLPIAFPRIHAICGPVPFIHYLLLIA